MGEVIEFEFVEGGTVYVQVNGVWRCGQVRSISGDNVEVRVESQSDATDEDGFVEWYTLDEVRVTEQESPMTCVTVYAVTRHFGGSEEGGWYWNRREAICSIPLVTAGDIAEIEQVTAFLRPRFTEQGNIYSVRGGVRYDIVAEREPRENEILVSGSYS